MTWLKHRVLIAPGADTSTDPTTWPWVDITRWVRARIRIRRGRPDESQQTPPASCQLRVDNAGGRFVARNPAGPWYPLLRRGCPLRVQVEVAGSWVDRFGGYIDELPVTWTPGSTDVYSDVTASGVLRRLQQGDRPLRSALFRQIVAASPVAYWPLEDGRDVLRARSAVGGPDMVTFGAVAPLFGSVDGPPGSAQLPDLSSHGSLSARGPTTAFGGQWQVEFWFRSLPGDSTTYTASVPLQWDTPGGTIVAWDVLLFVGRGDPVAAGLGCIGLDIAGYEAPTGGRAPSEGWRLSDVALIVDKIPSVQGQWHQLRITVEQLAGSVRLRAYLDDNLLGTATGASPLRTVASMPTNVVVNPLQGAGAYAGVDGVGISSVGHVAVYDTIANPGTYRAGMGWPGEPAADRVARLCAEGGIPAIATAGGEPMGPQRVASLPDLLRECEQVDGGVLYEGLDGILGYRRRDERYNQPAALSLRYRDLVGSLEPTDDDQRLRNDVEVSRPGGETARYVDEAHVAAEGRYDEQVTLNVATDAALVQHAAWRVHQGTVDELRYPQFSINLRGRPHLIPAWVACALGSRVVVSDLPPEVPGPVELLVEGYAELLDGYEWTATVDCSPASPWRVGVIEDPVLGRLDTAGSQLATVVGPADTTLLVSTTSGPRWATTTETAFPFDVVTSAGERMTVTDIAPLAGDTFTRTTASGWGSANVGGPYTTAGGVAGDYSVTGGTGRHTLAAVGSRITYLTTPAAVDCDVTVQVRVGTLATGGPITASVAGRLVDLGTYYMATLWLGTDRSVQLRLRRVVASTFGQLTSVPVPEVLHSTTGWITVRLQLQGPTLRARAWDSARSQPVAWHTTTTDMAITMAGGVGVRSTLETGNTNTSVTVDYDNLLATTDPQRITVTRGVNGVAKSHPVGSTVRLHQPIVMGL